MDATWLDASASKSEIIVLAFLADDADAVNELNRFFVGGVFFVTKTGSFKLLYESKEGRPFSSGDTTISSLRLWSEVDPALVAPAQGARW